MKHASNKVILCILDGFGAGEENEANAIFKAHTPNLDYILTNYSNSKLETSGRSVGLPDGQMGNSEVGHTAIGSGRIMETSLMMISDSIKKQSFLEKTQIQKIVQNNTNVHLIGLCSSGGIHSHADHIVALIEALSTKKKNIFLHLISDGRDSAFDSFATYLDDFFDKISHMDNVYIATVCGRYYAMDRDKNYERTAIFADLILNGVGENYDASKPSNKASVVASVLESYKDGVYDEFLLPKKYIHFHGIDASEDVIFANFRPDRMRQIVEIFVKKRILDLLLQAMSNNKNSQWPELPLGLSSKTKLESLGEVDFSDLYKNKENLNLVRKAKFGNVICMTNYFPDSHEGVGNFIDFLFQKNLPNNCLGEVVSKNNKSQIRIAETEKYAHVTYFFNGGSDVIFSGEDRILIPSAKVITHDTFPQMRAKEISLSILDAAKKNYDLIVANFANCDMVGHTGNFDATVKSAEVLDDCLGVITKKGLNLGYNIVITADHGNADVMIDGHGKKDTRHSLNPVYFILVSSRQKEVVLLDGTLADVGPTILDVMNIKKPIEMTGRSLIVKMP